MRLVRTVILLLVPLAASAQFSNDRCTWVSDLNKSVQLDSLSIVPNSLVIQDVDGITITHDISSGSIQLITSQLFDSVLVCYKVLPISLHQRYFHRTLDLYDSSALFKSAPPGMPDVQQREQLFATPELDKSGSISRGISFGNNQDVFVNSTLNLNLNGKLTDDLSIRANITDQNVPYQPEGNTQQLQDFDNVLIELYNDQFSLRGGDIVLQNQPSNFLRFYKNVQGAQARVQYNLVGDTAVSSAGISVAKGQFASVQLAAIEGSVGPYRINGPNNELFVIILANSERVFLDGERLERGFNKDYTIDYNIGEITFTNRVLITEFSRIRVDYEYSDQNFNRTIYTASHHQKIGKLRLAAQTYSEGDNRNRPLNFDLTNSDKTFLSGIGDELNLAVTSGADSVNFSDEAILYKQIDTLGLNGESFEIFKYSTSPDSAFFSVSFSDVGVGNGNYIQSQATVNGQVFQWVAPQAGIPQGQFEPIVAIPVPNKRQMTTLSALYEISKNETVFSEVAFSNQDRNLFSELGSDDDKGYAVKLGVRSNQRKLNQLPDYTLDTYIDFEYDDKNFNPIDRFRYIEFDRDWSYDPQEDSRRFNDNIFNTGFYLSKNIENHLRYDFSSRSRGDQVNGSQHKVTLNKKISDFQFRSRAWKMSNSTSSLKSSWDQLSLDASYALPWFRAGYEYSIDQNVVRTTASDSVISSAMYFNEHRAYLVNRSDSKMKFSAEYAYREDQRPFEGVIDNFSTSQTTRMALEKNYGSNRIKAIFNYRILDLQVEDEREETVSGRVDWSGNWLNKSIKSELTYAVSNGRELRREFVYIRVPAGQGTHTWRDLNDDGVQDLTEFFESLNPDERDYAKIFTPGREFVTAFQNLIVYRFSVQAPRGWKNGNGLKPLLAKFSNNTSWTADLKTTDDELTSRLLGFATDIDESLILTEKRNLRSTFFYNRLSSTFGVEGVILRQRNKQLLSNGFESRTTEEYALNARYNVTRRFNVKVKSAVSTKKANSDFLAGRQFQIESRRVNPEFSWQPNLKLRFTLQYNFQNKENVLLKESEESSQFNEFIFAVKYNKAIKSAINGSFRISEIAFVGDENTPVGYELLEALQPGSNYIWSLNWQQKITGGLQLNIIYDGRKSGSSDLIHVGRVQMSALF